MGGVDAVRLGVGAHALLLRQHGRVVLGLLEHLHRDLLRDVTGDRHRLVRRPVPAGALHRARLTAEQGAGEDLVVLHVDHPGELAQGRLPDVAGQLAQQGAVDADHPAAAVGHQRPALVVHDQAARRLHDDVADRLLRRLRPVAVAGEDLDVPEPREQRREQRQHEGLHHEEAQAALLRGGGADQDGGHRVSTPTRPDGSARRSPSAGAAAAARPRRPRASRWRSPAPGRRLGGHGRPGPSRSVRRPRFR